MRVLLCRTENHTGRSLGHDSRASRLSMMIPRLLSPRSPLSTMFSPLVWIYFNWHLRDTRCPVVDRLDVVIKGYFAARGLSRRLVAGDQKRRGRAFSGRRPAA